MPYHVYTRGGPGAVGVVFETAKDAIAKAAEFLDGHRQVFQWFARERSWTTPHELRSPKAKEGPNDRQSDNRSPGTAFSAYLNSASCIALSMEPPDRLESVGRAAPTKEFEFLPRQWRERTAPTPRVRGCPSDRFPGASGPADPDFALRIGGSGWPSASRIEHSK